jgi:hypothetical protein
MAIDNSAIAVAAPELITAMTGSNTLIGTLVANPTIIIFDNQSTTGVVLSINGVQWKTFQGGEAIVLDLRAAHGNARNYSFRVGDSFFGNGAANGNFSISYLYAQNI